MLKGIGAAALSGAVIGIGGVGNAAAAALPNEIVIEAESSTVRYSFEVSGRVEAGQYMDTDDTIVEGTIVDGAMDETSDVDDYRFSGTITSFEIQEGSATLTVNGERVDDPTGAGSDDPSGTTAEDRGDADGTGEYALVQGDSCVPVTPLSGDQPVEELYGYQLPADTWETELDVPDDGGPYYSATGLESLQRHDASVLFLYEGPDGLSLVVVHGKVGQSSEEGGSATFTVTGLPADGSWVVKDDQYFNRETGEPAPTNYDEWDVDGSTQTISWTWGQHGTDGGAFRGLGSDVEVTVEPAFNEEAERLGRNYPGEVIEWQLLSGDIEDPERTSLDMSTPITIRSGPC